MTIVCGKRNVFLPLRALLVYVIVEFGKLVIYKQTEFGGSCTAGTNLVVDLDIFG